jgi:hypothetical protein
LALQGLVMGALLFGNVAGAAGLRVGTGTAELVGDDSMDMAGGIQAWKATGQEGQLRAVATVIEASGSEPVAIVACDVLFVTGAMVDRATAEIEKRTGIKPERVLVNATHTHSAPSTVRVHGYHPNEKFVEVVVQGIIAAVERAQGAMRDDCRFAFALGEENTIGANSRLLLADKTIYWIGPKDDAVQPTGPFDPELPVWAFYDSGDKLLSLIYGHSTHTIGTIKGNVRSPSFYGLAAQELEQQMGGTVTFIEGASGSTHNLGTVTPAEAVVKLKSEIQATLDKAQTHPTKQVTALRRPFKFRVRTTDDAVEDEKVLSYCRKRTPEHADAIAEVFRTMRRELKPHEGEERTTWLQVILVGDVALVGVPAEFFTGLGVDIKHKSPYPDTYIAELANDWIGYIPDREGYELGGYQTWMGWHSYAEPGTGERIVAETVDMLNELKARR